MPPGRLQCDIYGLGFTQTFDLYFLLQREVAVFSKFQFVGAAAYFLESAGNCAGQLVVNKYLYITETGIDQQVAGKWQQIDINLLGGLVAYLNCFSQWVVPRCFGTELVLAAQQ